MEKHTALYFKEGSSDKAYQAHLQSHNDEWIGTFAYGRRGTTLTTGTKTLNPVSLTDAQRIFEKLVWEKIAKGYTEGEAGTRSQNSESGDSGIRPQLLNAISLEELTQLLTDDEFVLQPKMDGRRLLIRKSGNTVTGINRRGLECGMSVSIRDAVMTLPSNFVMDGEAPPPKSKHTCEPLGAISAIAQTPWIMHEPSKKNYLSAQVSLNPVTSTFSNPALKKSRFCLAGNLRPPPLPTPHPPI